MTTKPIRRAALALALLAGAACDNPVEGPGESPQGKLYDLPALGRGTVTGRFTSELWVRGSHAYTGTWGQRGPNRGNTLYVWNVRGPSPVLVDSVRVSAASTLGDVEVSPDGRHLVVATEGGTGSIVVFSLSDPARPREIARHATPNTANGVHTAELETVDGKLYAFLSVNPAPPRLVIVDLSDPARPREVLVRPMGGPIIHDVFVRAGYLFTALWDEGLAIWDIGGAGRGGSVANPVRISTIATVGGSAHNAWWFHDPHTRSRQYLFVGEEAPGSAPVTSAGDVHVVDVSNLDAPREVAFFSVPGAGTHNFSLDEREGVLYAAYYNAGVRALYVRGDLGTCTADQKDARGRCDLAKMGREVGRGLHNQGGAVYVWGVQQVGNHLYASDMVSGLWKLDVSALRR